MTIALWLLGTLWLKFSDENNMERATMYLAHWGLREAPFRNVIDPRYFFESRFCTADYNRTKGGVADRLLGVLRVPAFNRMFMAPANRLDLYSELARGKLVVFNTHKSRLGNDASAVLGRDPAPAPAGAETAARRGTAAVGACRRQAPAGPAEDLPSGVRDGW
jgi:hypothetical protein